MFYANVTDFLVPFDGSFDLGSASTSPPPDAQGFGKRALAHQIERIAELQRVLYAHDRYAVLLIFQAMDAAGKDGTIRAVMSGVNPAGCRVVSFKQPSEIELDHDYLWRTTRELPERGRIGVFNRSYYEEILIVRVHPEILEKQRLPQDGRFENIWRQRVESIHDHEEHLARNGTIILKFFLHVSRDEQRRRFLARLDNPDKHWKFQVRDIEESERWPQYMTAYQEALASTSRPWAPWYAIPADDKAFMRRQVALTVAESIAALRLRYPERDAATLESFDRIRARLRAES